ncbi:hypothetical protein IVB46_44195 [Bradyrhizobium sp. 61]|uniref:hypothetical protein n=1 Tax=Bradyrhizobium sp. 61 TaxID=2782679 RepID=UPI001FF968EF|nr:hypothetical protein [Bradyrhizobium sp. 61]MCK1282239.1 hypothetical protein [Bradyrhizobium sp. 61]
MMLARVILGLAGAAIAIVVTSMMGVHYAPIWITFGASAGVAIALLIEDRFSN